MCVYGLANTCIFGVGFKLSPSTNFDIASRGYMHLACGTGITQHLTSFHSVIGSLQVVV